MPSDASCKEICAVNIDTPKLLESIIWVRNSIIVLRKPSRGDKVVDLSVIFEDFLDSRVDGIRIRDIGVMSCNFGNSTDSQF